MSTATLNPTVNLAAKSQLARLLATENLSIVHSTQARTASFSTEERKLTLPVWSKATDDLYDMLVTHEVGHALHTPSADTFMPVCEEMSPGNPEAFFAYLNIVEDVRIDSAMKSAYPGTRRSYFNGMKELMDSDFFGVRGQNIAELSLGDRINLQTKAGQYGFVDVPFSDAERVILDEVLAAKSFDDVIAVAKKIWNNSGAEDDQSQQQTNSAPAKGDEGSGDGESDGNSPDQGDQEGKQDQGTPQNGPNEDPRGGQSKAGSAASQSRDLKTTKSMEQKIKNLTSTDWKDSIIYFDAPNINLKSVIWDHKTVHADLDVLRTQEGWCGNKVFSAIESRNKDFVANLVKQFEQKMAAETIRRTRTAKTGRLDMRKIANYKFSDDLFVKNQTTTDGKNHGMVFMMDWSGSMSDYLMPTVEQMIALCLFCRKMNIPFEVFAFTNSMPVREHEGYYNREQLSREEIIANLSSISPDYKIEERNDYYGSKTVEVNVGNNLRIDRVGMIHFLSSKMNNKEFRNAVENLCQLALIYDHSGVSFTKEFPHMYINSHMNVMSRYGLSGTPLNEAMYLLLPIVSQFKVANRLDIVNTIVLTDGGAGSYIADRCSGGNVIINLPNRAQFPLYTTAQASSQGRAELETSGLARLVKHVTGSNMISIRIGNKRESGYIANSVDQKNAAKLNSQFKQNGFFSYTSRGFDESFFIDANIEVMDTDEVLANVKDDASVGVITRAFIKNNSKRANSRVLLNRFSDLIAKKILA